MSDVIISPLHYEAAFGAANRPGAVIHRIRDIERLRSYSVRIRYRARWICGATCTNAIPVDDPAAGRPCMRCEIQAASAVVYRCYSAAGELLYIGSTISWQARESMHRKSSRWWPHATRVDRTPYPDLPSAQYAEAAAIEAEAPLHNVQHNIKRLRRVHNGYVPVEPGPVAA